MTIFREMYGSYHLIKSGTLQMVYRHRSLPDVALVFTDIMQGYDQTLALELPGKGKVANEISVFWHAKFNK